MIRNTILFIGGVLFGTCPVLKVDHKDSKIYKNHTYCMWKSICSNQKTVEDHADEIIDHTTNYSEGKLYIMNWTRLFPPTGGFIKRYSHIEVVE